MKLIHAFSIALLAVTPAAHAQSSHGHDHDAAAQGAKPVKADGHSAKGTIKSVNASKGTVTIAHGPVKSLNWPGMTMAFKAKDKQMLEQAKPGKEVEFEFQQRGKEYVITSLKPAAGP